MNILWLTWKDLKNPEAGGAEVVNEELARRLAADGHNVKLIVAAFPGAAGSEHINGYEIIRLGSRYTVYYHAWRYYRRSLQDWPNLIIDEVNTIPFFARLYARQPVVMFFHMLCREIWFYQMVFPLSLIGYLLEPLYLRLLSASAVITVSGSTKHDLIRNGFKPSKISVISEGIELEPVAHLTASDLSNPTVLSLGAVRPMKRTLHQLQAFELAKRTLPDLKLVIAGSAAGPYGAQLIRAVERSPFRTDITVLGRVSEEQKRQLLRTSQVLLVTAVKEGWGLTVTEAASQGLPAIVYDVDGLRDSVRDGHTGLITKPKPAALAAALVQLLADPDRYQRLRKAGWQWSHEITFDHCYNDFMKAIPHA